MNDKKPPEPIASEGGDADSWREITQGVTPLEERHVPLPLPPSKPGPLPESADAPVLQTPERTGGEPTTSFDHRTRRQISRGRMPIEGRLDLHGMTQARAWDVLQGFLNFAVGQGWRTVLVITGRGREGQGTLRTMLPHWLASDELRGWVIGHDAAEPSDGGDGAFYIRLRRK